MRTPFTSAATLLLSMLVTSGVAAHSQAAAVSWLDEPTIASWNAPGQAIPAAPAVQDPVNPRCRDLPRPPQTDEDEQVRKHGWDLIHAFQGGWQMLVVRGTASYDGMCRPLQFQDFVFVRGIFAGTLSPVPMDSRTDGALSRVVLQGAELMVEYTRYETSDPLCCPSRITRVVFEVAGDPPIVRARSASTSQTAGALATERLFGWHASLFPTGRSGMHRIRVGTWRDDRTAPMQVVSGPVGRERVHFEAPRADQLEEEMQRFLGWFNDDTATEPVLKAALAHLWFVTIHPFDDGNGRIARAIADMSLARSEGSSQRFYSMSAQVREERNDYYGVLERTQKETLDITLWMAWFLGCLTRAIEDTQAALSGVVARAQFWEKLLDVPLNDRQRMVISTMLEGFEGKLTTSKWAAMTKSSNDTALRDIQQLVDRGMLVRDAAGGRSTSYSLAALR